MTEYVEKYLLKEAEFLRNIYNERAKETRLLERYSLLATGAIWSWCAANPDEQATKLLLWVPAIITCVFGVRAYSIGRIMRATREYLASLESKLGLPKDFGWGHQLKQQEPGQLYTALMFWFILQVFTLGLAVWCMVKCV